MNKKIISLVLAGILGMSIVGCGSETKDEKPTQKETISQTQEISQTQKEVISLKKESSKSAKKEEPAKNEQPKNTAKNETKKETPENTTVKSAVVKKEQPKEEPVKNEQPKKEQPKEEPVKNEQPKEEPKNEQPKEEPVKNEPSANTIDGHKFVRKFDKAVITEYSGDSVGCLGTKLKGNYSCASHNMPCGTKVYIPSLKGVINDTGIFEVEDTGGMSFDFDIYVSGSKKGKIGKKNMDVYVLEWGNKSMTSSYTYIINYFKRNGSFEKYRKSWNAYINMGGKLIYFWDFKSEDKNLNINNV